MKRTLELLKKLFCKHKYSSDTQLRIIKCSKCGDTYWYDYEDLFTASGKKYGSKIVKINKKYKL